MSYIHNFYLRQTLEDALITRWTKIKSVAILPEEVELKVDDLFSPEDETEFQEDTETDMLEDIASAADRIFADDLVVDANANTEGDSWEVFEGFCWDDEVVEETVEVDILGLDELAVDNLPEQKQKTWKAVIFSFEVVFLSSNTPFDIVLT